MDTAFTTEEQQLRGTFLPTPMRECNSAEFRFGNGKSPCLIPIVVTGMESATLTKRRNGRDTISRGIILIVVLDTWVVGRYPLKVEGDYDLAPSQLFFSAYNYSQIASLEGRQPALSSGSVEDREMRRLEDHEIVPFAQRKTYPEVETQVTMRPDRPEST